MTGNEAGRILVTAKGPSLKFKQFDPTTFITPAVNRGLLVMSGAIFAWIVWACAGTDRFMARPFWDKTISLLFDWLVFGAALGDSCLSRHNSFAKTGSPVEGTEQERYTSAAI
jgi:hypothetical protein